jgi:DNA polymerase III epsilon subunit-like protein
MSVPASKKLKFSVNGGTPPPVRAKVATRVIPRCSELLQAPSLFRLVPPPDHVKRKLLHGNVPVMGFDVETHDWVDRDSTDIKGSFGQHGFYNLCRPLDFDARVVQLGWAIADCEGNMQVKECIIKPADWTISSKAAMYHGISQQCALDKGRDLHDVLAGFLIDARNVCAQGGRLVAHHIEFDSGLLRRELERCRMDCCDEWSKLVTMHGYCTMCPEVGRWLRDCSGLELGPETAKHTMRLQVLADLYLSVEQKRDIVWHSAGSDSKVHAMLFLAIAQLAQGLCLGRQDGRQAAPL